MALDVKTSNEIPLSDRHNELYAIVSEKPSGLNFVT